MFTLKRAVQDYLRNVADWRTAGSIYNVTGVTPVEMRRIANAYPQTFVSSQSGYKLAALATADEIEDSIRVLLSRAEKIMHRARSLQRLSLEKNKAARRVVRNAAKWAA
jgi:hypothetical protein